MKSILTATCAAALFSTTAQAGGMAEPIEMAPVEVVEDTGGGTSANLVVPLILIALIAAAVSAGDGGSGEPTFSDSDQRLKDNVTRVGTAANDLPLYHFSYRGSSLVFEGIMAQDVLAHSPAAVVTRPGGTLAVDYGMLGIELKVVR